MKVALCVCVVTLIAVFSSAEKHTPPKVMVYSRDPAEFGKDNVLICHVTGFYPPDLSITLLKNGVELPGSNLTDLAFHKNWHFHLTRSVSFNPASGEEFNCRVVHRSHSRNYAWEPNM